MKQKQKIVLWIAILAVALLVVIAIVIYNQLIKYIYPKEYIEFVEKYSEEYGVDESLIYAIIKTESGFDPNAISSKKAIGLMQIMEATAKEMVLKNGLDIDYLNLEEELLIPEKNIEIGTVYILELLKRYDDTYLAVAAYNAGIGTVDNWIEKGILRSDGSDIEKIPYKETNNYVRKISTAYKIYEK